MDAIHCEQLVNADKLICYCETGSLSQEAAKNRIGAFISGLLVEPHGIQDHKENHVLSLINDTRDIHKKRILALVFLRLLPISNMVWLQDPPWRPVISKLLDDEFANSLYKEWRIEAGDQSHQKLDRIARCIDSVEELYFEDIQEFTSLDKIRPHRQKIMKAVKSKVGEIIIAPFLQEGAIQGLNELYDRVGAYLANRDEFAMLDARQEIDDQVNNVKSLLSSYSTKYSDALSIGVVDKIIAFIDDDFKKGKIAQSANLVIESHLKKYPLHLIDHMISIGLVIRNEGTGYAYDTQLSVAADDGIEINNDKIKIGNFAPGNAQLIEISARIIDAKEEILIISQLSWTNFDRSKKHVENEFQLKSQKIDIDWDQLIKSAPYSLEPILTESQLVGRRDILDRLIGLISTPSVGSAVIRGQKRVGKTSIAKALESRAREQGFITIYLEGGDYVQPSAISTIKALGKTICELVISADKRLSDFQIPVFEDALSPITNFLNKVFVSAPDKRLLIFLDEFDTLPIDLYERGPIGDALFQTLRSISNRAEIGFILIGSEKMKLIWDRQGGRLNKWEEFEVDYFSLEKDGSDYLELVERPVSNSLEYTQEAIRFLFDVTAGNPYFTKLICRDVFHTAATNRDSYITDREINKAYFTTANDAGLGTFSHFWEDFIFETGEQATQRMVRRRKVLIAVSHELIKQKPAPVSKILDHYLVKHVIQTENDLNEFVARGILRSVLNDGVNMLDFKVLLFREWLNNKGVNDIIPSLASDDELVKQVELEERLKVKSSELQALSGKWSYYKGQAITADKIRIWLDQFTDIPDQRLMFTILDSLRFYSEGYVRQKMRDVVHKSIRAGLTHYMTGVRKRADILVSYIDDLTKSSQRFASLYADEADVYIGNIVEKGQLAKVVRERENIQAVVFFDDFVGTGKSAIGYLSELNSQIGGLIQQKKIKAIFWAMVAYKDGWRLVQDECEKNNIPFEIHCCEILDESLRCFHEKSIFFPDQSLRNQAKRIAETKGLELEKKCPLGYGNLEMAVVFEDSCPNNSLPILWKDSPKLKWQALFKRT